MRFGDAVRTALRGVGQTLITVGVVLLLFCVYELKITNLVTEREQEQLREELAQAWAEPPPPDPAVRPAAVELGEGIAVLRIPRLDDDADDPYATVVVEGTSPADLKKGPGRLVESDRPGELGNLVISGHRTTYGAPFADLDRLAPGDAVVVETRDTWYTYRVTGTEIVAPSAVEVTLPVPKRPGVEPTESVLTLTTCHPRYSARQRMVVFARLDETLAKSDGDPAALTVAAGGG
ncbi:MAG TPA: class E sortase [Mycobacteriales bacterium]|nr:class E sortase [Mycobacteriales bacterium]